MEAETCQGFLRRMEPTARWAAARHAASHPYLGSDDLFQDAMEALVRAWQALYPMPPDDLARVGRQAILWRLRRARERARAFGEGEVVLVSTDGPRIDEYGPARTGIRDYADDRAVGDLLGEAGDADCFFPVVEILLERALSPNARAVLQQLMNPGPRMLAAVRAARRRWAGQRGNWWRAERVETLRKGASLSRKKVENALVEIQQTVYRKAGGLVVDKVDNNTQRGRTPMTSENKGGLIPEGTEAGLPEEPVKKKTTPAAGATSRKAAAASSKKAKKVAAPKKTKKAGKANGAAFQKAGKVGVIDTIIEACLKGATKGQVYEKLTKRFPDRDLKGMRATVHIYLGGRLARDKGYKINKKGSGKEATYTVVAPKQKDAAA